jgi:hypothetical protein
MRTTYNAAVEVATKQHLDVDELISALAEYHAAVGTSAHGWLEVRISVPAANLAQACATALSVASAATGAEAIACEVMTAIESDEREGFVPAQRTAWAAHWT